MVFDERLLSTYKPRIELTTANKGELGSRDKSLSITKKMMCKGFKNNQSDTRLDEIKSKA